MRARDATPGDAEAIARIYNAGIAERVATFETALRTADDIRAWFDGTHPIVAVEDARGAVIAFAATSTYRPRACYAGIAEFSVYVDPGFRRRGAGRLALSSLLPAAEAAGFTKLVSRIFVENASSRALMHTLGFREVGVYERHGKLEGAWRDVVIVERLLMKTVLFVCVHNAGRSQMAEALVNHRASARGLAVRAESAGTVAGAALNPAAVAAMREIGVSLEGHRPKLLTPDMAARAQRIVTMGCGVDADACPARIHVSEDWGLDDPRGQPIEAVRAIRDQIRERVERLLDQWT